VHTAFASTHHEHLVPPLEGDGHLPAIGDDEARPLGDPPRFVRDNILLEFLCTFIILHLQRLSIRLGILLDRLAES
jgi:hypothetical protein